MKTEYFVQRMALPDKYTHRHLYFFHKVWDLDHDGWLSAEDFDNTAETLSVLQRHGKWEEDVVERWKQYLRGWWDILVSETRPIALSTPGFVSGPVEHRRTSSPRGFTDSSSVATNDDEGVRVSFEDWMRFLNKVSILSDNYDQLPDFLRAYANLLFVRMDSNKDGLICVKDYRMYLAQSNMDIMRANDCFAFMLTSQDIRNESILTRQRFDELFFEYWTNRDPNCYGQYLLGPYDSVPFDQLLRMSTPSNRGYAQKAPAAVPIHAPARRPVYATDRLI
ncbi:uncharacterized protein LOC129595736 [Paramacrobiotus metropolitanus]|uniref:uncharacterized protein LOC129595736 n=1 Tax=Paramacrobiotus metropolitanus TaxID=2943436 RepID=UPI0024457566|nr:uncharacterized protein LOC129595736 [Paramacrobiotus metropolitanus]